MKYLFERCEHMKKRFIFQVFYRCVIDTLVYTSDYYNSYDEYLKAAKSCEDNDHFAIVSAV